MILKKGILITVLNRGPHSKIFPMTGFVLFAGRLKINLTSSNKDFCFHLLALETKERRAKNKLSKQIRELMTMEEKVKIYTTPT
jgi:hypothetical protein